MQRSEYQLEDAPVFNPGGNNTVSASHFPDRFFASHEFLRATRETQDPNLVEINGEIIRIQALEGAALYRITDVFPEGYGYTREALPRVIGEAPAT